MQARRLTATVFTGVLLAAGCSSSPDEATTLPPPAVDETIDTDATFPDDGLTRYIITPIAGGDTDGAEEGGVGATDGETSDGETSGEDEGPSGEGEASLHLTPELMALVPDGASLAQRDGRLGYTDESGDFVAFPSPDDSDDEASSPGSTADQAPPDEEDEGSGVVAVSFGNPYVDELAANPAVESVLVIGDGTYGVTVSDPSAIDPTIFAIAEDVPFGHAAEGYEGYQWALENDGVSLEGVRRIDQVEDADLDVAPTVGRADGSGVVVAVIDSGVDFSHPDLAGSSWSNPGEVCGNEIDDDGNGYIDDCNGWDFGNGDPTSYDPGANPHGTHVAGIITADRNGQGVAGIAPAAMIMDLNVGSRSAAGESISGASITAAIRYAVDNGANVINLSLGTEPGTPAAGVAPMGGAIEYAASKGVVVVAAAGNHGTDLGSTPVYPASFNKPNMLVVGASTPSDTRAGFSNHNADIVDLYAPGELILSTMPGNDYQFMSGTSQASPTTAASVALVIESDPDATMSDVIATVIGAVDRKEALSTSTTSGRLNSARAIDVHDESTIPAELDVAVSGLRDPGNEIAATVDIATPPDAFSEPYHWELSLIHSDDTGTYAIIDHPVTVAGSLNTTGDNGAIDLLDAESAAAVGTATVKVATQLPAGRYSFVVEAVPTADPSYRLGDAFIASFEIPGDTDESIPITTTPTTTRPEATSSTTAGPTDNDTAGGGTDGTGSTPTPESTSTTAVVDESGSSNGGGTPGPDPTTSGANPTTDNSNGSGASGGSGGSDGEPGTGDTDTGAGQDGGTDTGSTTSTQPGSETPTTRPGTSGETGGGSTTTSAPVSDEPGTDAADTQSGLGTGAAKKGAWESTSVQPQTGPVRTANSVQIVGNFPSKTYVWFGDQPGQVVFQDRTLIMVRTPLRAEPGVVDITLQKSRRGVVLRIPDAYAFVGDDAIGTDEPGGDPGGTTDDRPDGDDGDTGSGGDDQSNGGPDGSDTGGDDENNGGDNGSDGSTGDGIGSDDNGDGSTGADGGTEERNDRRARMTVGSPTELTNGLVGRPITPNLPSGVRICSTDPCPAVRR